MSSFEFFMGLYGLLLGLAVAEILSGFGNILRLRERPRWGTLTPLSGLTVFLMIVTAFIDAWHNLQHVSITLRGLAVPVAIAISYFFAALMLVPRDTQEWPDLDAYFLARRKLVFAPLIVPVVLTIAFLEAPKWPSEGGPGLTYILVNILLLGLPAVPLVTARPRIIKIALILFLLIVSEIYFTEMLIRDQVNWLLGHPSPPHAPAPAAASVS